MTEDLITVIFYGVTGEERDDQFEFGLPLDTLPTVCTVLDYYMIQHGMQKLNHEFKEEDIQTIREGLGQAKDVMVKFSCIQKALNVFCDDMEHFEKERRRKQKVNRKI